ncbi:hypothetical protein LCGC14_1021490 [marine sediment metagenome]|uniref:Uncharacterized protein n=1 Tax=marine sediment metagenome TaxID=412755 RepID=A0A0F9R390_9ZZZZ
MIFSPELESDSHSLESCGICHSKIKKKDAVYNDGLHTEEICPQCYSRNSEEDIKLIVNMFMAFGGYFGRLRDPNFPVKVMLKCLLNEIQANKGTMPIESLKLKLLHLALLHGVTPEEFSMIDNNILKCKYCY